jgi:trk system potassium uptake protein TrkH
VFVQSYVLFLYTALMLLMSLVGFWDSPREIHAMLEAAAICGGTGAIALLISRIDQFELTTRQLFAVTTMSWCTMSLAGAIPLYLLLPGLSFTDAVFESVSGVTTTGATVLSGLESLPHTLLLWRALLQWMGGIGIIVLGIAILPFLQVGGMRLFKTESSDWSHKTMPKSRDLIRAIGIVYVALSTAAVLGYWLAGMDSFDAVVHAMTTVSTGGYSNYDASMGHFHDKRLILWLSTVLMLISSLPFLLYTRMVRGEIRALLTDNQVLGFVGFVFVMILSMSLVRRIADQESWIDSVTQSAFNVVSIVTTTGYASENYTSWDSFAVTMFFYLTFVGGCSGSTAGGMKFFRFQIGLIMLKNQLRWMRHPRGVFTNRYNGQKVTDEIVRSVIAFSFYYGLTVAVIASGLSLLGIDFLTSVSGAASAVGNVGPGLGDIIGPDKNFAALPHTAKWLLSIGMLLGRLEIMTVVILFTPVFWRR